MQTSEIAKRAARLARESRLLVLLQALSADPDYAINNFVLHALLSEFGHGIPADRLMTDIAWLVEQGLVTSENAGCNMIVVTITRRGVDTARGVACIPGIARPEPGDAS